MFFFLPSRPVLGRCIDTIFLMRVFLVVYPPRNNMKGFLTVLWGLAMLCHATPACLFIRRLQSPVDGDDPHAGVVGVEDITILPSVKCLSDVNRSCTIYVLLISLRTMADSDLTVN